MGHIMGINRNLLNVEGRYGEDSEAAHFLREYVVEKGKVLIERTTVEAATDKKHPAIRIVRPRNIVLESGSKNYAFGHEVLIPSSAPAIEVGRQLKDDRVVAVFVVVDERDIYASRIVR